MNALIRTCLLSVLLMASGVGAFTLEEFQFDSPQQQAEFRDLIAKLRCPVCQNESLGASQADVAQDLRLQVYQMMRAGKSEDEILDFLVARYGDYVRYEPPLKPSTYVLWFGPFVLIGVGGFFLLRALLRKRASPEETVSAADRKRLDELLAAADGNRKPKP